MNCLIILIVIVIIIIIVIIFYSSSNNCKILENFRRIPPNKMNVQKAYNQRNNQKAYNQRINNQKNNQFAVNCYNDTACQNQPNGTGCRTILYTDGICLNESCIPTDDYDEYRNAIIKGNTQGVQNIETYAKLYQNYESQFTPRACPEYTSG